MKNAEQFIEHCKKVVADYDAGKLPSNDAAAKIYASPFRYPFNGPVHPMVYKVADLAFDIAEGYRSEKEDKADWAVLTKTLNNYIVGNWESTYWILSALYGEYGGDKLVHSYGVAVRRQKGETIIETASDEMKDTVRASLEKLNAEQTDERYLQNLKIIIPKEINKYRLANVEVKEYLTKPYYSTVS